MQIKICESCGMPMMSEEHYPLGKIDSKYCVHCTDEFGNLKSFEEKVIDITNLMVSKQNMTEDEAKKMAINHLKAMPAWNENYK